MLSDLTWRIFPAPVPGIQDGRPDSILPHPSAWLLPPALSLLPAWLSLVLPSPVSWHQGLKNDLMEALQVLYN